jgi:hypothetical protein
VGGDGGDAFSNAIATGAGPSAVEAHSDARAGAGGAGLDGVGIGGLARARAEASGVGDALAAARALGAIAEATSVARGGTSRATSDAATEADSQGWLIARADHSGGTQATAGASATRGQSLDRSVPSETDVVARFVGDPLGFEVAAALAANPRLAAALEAAGSEVAALAFAGGDTLVSGATPGSSADFEITFSSVAILPGIALGLGLLDAEFDGTPFEQLALDVEVDGESVFAEEFTSVEAARTALDDRYIDLGVAGPGPDAPDLRVRWNLVGGQTGASYALDFLVATQVVPEPGTALLLLGGLGLLSRRRRPGSSARTCASRRR